MDEIDPLNTFSLAAVNQKAVATGEVLPAVRLRDGTLVQTGTVAAMLKNIEAYNAGARGEVERDLVLAVPTLIKLGLFELFPVEEWLAGTNPGRRFLGLAALAQRDESNAP
jgi:hypothetical protein